MSNHTYDVFTNELVTERSAYAPPERYIEITDEESAEVIEKSLLPWLLRHGSSGLASAVVVALEALKERIAIEEPIDIAKGGVSHEEIKTG